MKRLLSLLCILSLLAAFTVAASAEAPLLVSNVIKGATPAGGSSTPAGRPGVNDILATGYGDKLTLPKSYLDSYEVAYVNAPSGNSVYTYRDPRADQNRTMPYAFHGVKALVLARQGEFSCILYHGSGSVPVAAWINSEHLSATYPGTVVTIGSSGRAYNAQNIGDVEVQWSSNNFVGSGQKYSLLDSPVKSCTGFTLDYHVIGRNGAQTQQVLGPRTVYVNDGSGWVEVGSFEYNAMAPIHVVVYLDSPMTVAAVATTAACAKPDTFSFRQTLLDVMVN